MKQSSTFTQAVFAVTSQIPRGKVTTYGSIAAAVGLKSPRVVGNILHRNTDPITVPCHRVVRSDGKLASNYAFGGEPARLKRLQDEGIAITHNRVDLNHYLWQPQPHQSP